jgi:NAD(P)-dependent dehydrogenase (short-subunit alcohol dehydrogenase family)
MKRILVIGGTGNVGRAVIGQLLPANVKMRALARNPESAILPPEVELVRGDPTIPDSLDRALDDVDAVFLVWVASPKTVVPVMANRLPIRSTPNPAPVLPTARLATGRSDGQSFCGCESRDRAPD